MHQVEQRPQRRLRWTLISPDHHLGAKTSTVQIRPGDVITYTDRDPDSSATRIVTHRVVAVEQGPGGLSFRTKGDANNTPDQRPTAAADVHGVLWYSVPAVGWLREFLISPAGLSYLVGIVLLMVAGHLVLPKTRQPANRHTA